VYLNEANFQGNTDFTKSTFERVADISGAQFNGATNFDFSLEPLKGLPDTISSISAKEIGELIYNELWLLLCNKMT
jgi:predicted Zn-dependent peptidase